MTKSALCAVLLSLALTLMALANESQPDTTLSINAALEELRPENMTVFGRRPETIPYQPLNSEEFQSLQRLFGPPTENLRSVINGKARYDSLMFSISPDSVRLGPVGANPLALLLGTLIPKHRGRSLDLVPGFHPAEDVK